MDISFLELYWCSYLLVKIGFFLELNLYSIHKSKLTTHGFFLVLFFPVLTYQRWILLCLILPCSYLSRWILLDLFLPCSLLSKMDSSWSYSSMFSLIRDIFLFVLFFHVLSYQRWILLGHFLPCSFLSKMDSSWSYSSMLIIYSRRLSALTFCIETKFSL